MYADKRLDKPGVATPTSLLPSHLLATHAQAPMHAHTHAFHALHHTHAQSHTPHAAHLNHSPHHHQHPPHVLGHHQHQQQQQQQQQHSLQQPSHHNLQQQQQHQASQQQHDVLLRQQQHQQQQQQLQQTQHQLQQAQQTVSGQQSPNQPQQQQHQNAMFSRFDANKSTKGASKMRRDLINAEIANLRDLLPLPQSTRQRLSQLQLMALVCVYVRKANYFQQVFKRQNIMLHQTATPNIGFSKALSGFLMMLTQNGKLLYISDNAAEYLGHSMEDLLIHGDSVYDIIDKQDHTTIQAELNRNVPPQPGGHQQQLGGSSGGGVSETSTGTSLEGEHRMFLCRMNVSRNARRQMRFGDQKVVLVQGHYLSFLPLCSRNEPVFLATCTPIAMPETRECVVQGATNVFTTIHSMDMKIAHIDKNGEFHLGYSKAELQGTSWYNLIHNDNLREAQSKHRLITQSEQDRSCILLVRMQCNTGEYSWVHVVLQVRDSPDSTQQPVIVCTNQVLNDREASIMIANSWLYHYYTVQSKIQFGMPIESSMRVPPTTPAPIYYQHHAAAAAAIQHHTTTGQHHTGSAFHNMNHLHHPHAHPHPHQYHTHHISTAAAYGGVYHTESVAGALPTSNGNGVVELKDHNSQLPHQYTSSSSSGLNYHSGLGTEPVDYSQQQQQQQLSGSHMRSSSSSPQCQKSTGSTHRLPTITPPPPKKRARNKLEPLYLQERSSPEHQPVTPELETHYQLHATYPTSVASASEAHGSVIFATIVPTRPRLLNKTLQADPADFIDQWNPSPPWSESAQKVSLDSFSSSHELSPGITTTPPTPTSATPLNNGGGVGGAGANANIQSIGPAFSFEWMSDPLVPVVDSCLTCVPPEGIPVVMTAQHTQWTHTSATPLGSTDHHQHLSQHLAQSHRMLNIHNGSHRNGSDPNDINGLEQIETNRRAIECASEPVDNSDRVARLNRRQVLFDECTTMAIAMTMPMTKITSMKTMLMTTTSPLSTAFTSHDTRTHYSSESFDIHLGPAPSWWSVIPDLDCYAQREKVKQHEVKIY